MNELDIQLLTKKINSCMISDILDDLGIDSVITGLVPNIPTAKIFGRASTLKIRELKEGEDYKGIYSALSSYEKIHKNDIIIVENECAEYAYFGELNCSLAIRSGAAGTIIGGKTRDYYEVLEKGFPVFSSGYNCKDVRRRATLESMNKPIYIQNIEIEPGCLVFADINGIAVIPKYLELDILNRVREKADMEKKVLVAINNKFDPLSIVDKIGEF